MKTYKFYGHSLHIGDKIVFVDGTLSTDDKEIQKIIESHPLFKDGQIYISSEIPELLPASEIKILHASDLPKDNSCPECDFIGKNKMALILHLRKHPNLKYVKEE